VQINKLVGLWSAGRLVWGIASIISMYYNWASSASGWQFSVGLVTVFLVSEILPFMVMPSFSVPGARPAAGTTSRSAALLESNNDDGTRSTQLVV
jgi:hypothetical protein